MEWVNENSVYTQESDCPKERHVPRLMIQFSYRIWIKLNADNPKNYRACCIKLLNQFVQVH